MELSFANRLLRELSESSAKADRKFGLEVANNVRLRLADLRAATSVHDLLVGEFRETGEKQITLDVCAGVQIIFCPNHNAVSKLESGAIDWARVSRIKIVRIEIKDA